MRNINPHKHFAVAFWITLTIAIGLIIGGFFTPPMGEVSGSVLTAVGEIFLWPSLAFGAKTLDTGHQATIKKGDVEINIKEKED